MIDFLDCSIRRLNAPRMQQLIIWTEEKTNLRGMKARRTISSRNDIADKLDAYFSFLRPSLFTFFSFRKKIRMK